MKDITVLTKEACPECKKLKLFISKALRGDEKERFKFVVKEEDEKEYNKLVENYNVKSLPVIIKDDVAVMYTTNALVKKLASS